MCALILWCKRFLCSKTSALFCLFKMQAMLIPYCIVQLFTKVPQEKKKDFAVLHDWKGKSLYCQTHYFMKYMIILHRGSQINMFISNVPQQGEEGLNYPWYHSWRYPSNSSTIMIILKVYIWLLRWDCIIPQSRA